MLLGKLFHIDFGYILGRDPKPLPPPMKLSKEMVRTDIFCFFFQYGKSVGNLLCSEITIYFRGRGRVREVRRGVREKKGESYLRGNTGLRENEKGTRGEVERYLRGSKRVPEK